MKVIVVEPQKTPVVREIDPGLESMQKIVGGSIEAVYPFEEPVALICNDEGKLLGLPLNRALRDDEGNVYDIDDFIIPYPCFWPHVLCGQISF